MLKAKFPFKQIALAGTAALTALVQPSFAEVSAIVPSGSGFVVKDANEHERFRVQDDGSVRVPGLPSATVEENLVCSDAASGQLGNCGAVAINKAEPAEGIALDVNGNVAASNVNVTGDLMVNGVSAGVPAGAVMSFAGSACPSGWLKADGSELVRADEPTLFAAVGTLYGAPSSDTFNVPSRRAERTEICTAVTGLLQPAPSRSSGTPPRCALAILRCCSASNDRACGKLETSLKN